MNTVFVLFGVTIIAEMLLYAIPGLWHVHRLRTIYVACLVISTALVSGFIASSSLSILLLILAVTTLYRIINLLRIVEKRMNDSYLRSACLRSSAWLVGISLLILITHIFHIFLSLSRTHGLALLLVFQLLASTILCVSALNAIKKYRFSAVDKHYASRDLPTVSVAIPARDETTDLFECLQSLVNSDYPKLEIIVLDESTHSKVPEIVRQFAHDGVRFMKGTAPRDNWLAKNQAYEDLTQGASGDLMLFCGVDVRFEPHTITNLVESFITKDLRMATILPFRPIAQVKTLFIQPLRYWWELAVPRFLLSQPPSLSTCWMVDRDTVLKLGGFSAVSRRVRPETFFARECAKNKQYDFIIDDNCLGVTTLKTATDQFKTAVRVRYPEMHKRPESVLLLSLFEIAVFILPFVMVPVWLMTSHYVLATLALIAALLLVVIHILIMRISTRRGGIIGLFNYPIIGLIELYMVNISMWRYEFGTVYWKNRDITTPVMHTTPNPNTTAN